MKKVTVACLISLLLLLLFVAPGFAESFKKNIEVSYSNIQIMINGKIIIPRDVNGTIVEPFIYNGTTYLPVRAVSEALDKVVGWDAATQTVYVSEKGNVNNQAPAQVPTQTPTQTDSQTQTAANPDITAASANEITVYVSNASDTIHLISNCSGMKNYRTMTLAEAREISASYCSKCAGHLKDIE